MDWATSAAHPDASVVVLGAAPVEGFVDAAYGVPAGSSGRGGSFGGFGVDPIDLGVPAAASRALSVGTWLARDRGRTVSRFFGVPEGATAEQSRSLGTQLLEPLQAEHTVLVVAADGPATMTAKAPGAFDERAPATDETLATALEAADLRALAAFDPALGSSLVFEGRPTFALVATACEQDSEGATGSGPGGPAPTWRTQRFYRDAPLGVGYHVVAWRRL